MSDTNEQLQDQDQHSTKAKCSLMFIITDDGNIHYDGFFEKDEEGINNLAFLYSKLKYSNAVDLLFSKLIQDMNENEALVFAESVILFRRETEPLIQPFDNHQAFNREEDEN